MFGVPIEQARPKAGLYYCISNSFALRKNMDRVAVFVDAGYLYAGGSTAISGASKKRSELTLNVPASIQYLIKQAEQISGMKLLRIYWYDGAVSNRLGTDQQLLASSDNVKLRLGIVNTLGQQKGVDSKIVTDLSDLARNRAISEAVLVGGDEDLRIGMELAQQYGVRVHLLTIEGSSCSVTLRQESDTHSTIAKDDVRAFLSVVVPPAAPTATATATAATTLVPVAATAVNITTVFGAVVKDYLSSLAGPEQAALKSAIQAGKVVPTEHDGRLLATARTKVGRLLDNKEKTMLRDALKTQLGI
jgi:uncharacterized LabA/DUF88 family protein